MKSRQNSIEAEAPNARRFIQLTIGSVGILYGDVSTSPLYTFRAAASAAARGDQVSNEAVLAVTSLILWALILVFSCKYILVLLPTDNNGEGGILALLSIARRYVGDRLIILVLGTTGAGLFFGSAIITPAISMISSFEGLQLVTPAVRPYIIPLSVVSLILLFAVQSMGTARLAAWFGPVMTVWILTIGLAGVPPLLRHPEVFAALNPMRGLLFVSANWTSGLLTIGAVLLTVTGGEAIYAGLGHFGRKPLQVAWLVLFPAIALNYLGQAALVLSDHRAVEHPFFSLFPDALLVPIVGLSTVVAAIAGQGVITGAFSVARQAVQLELLPKLEIRHTSEIREGQIYVPRVNILLLLGAVSLIIGFQSSDNLAFFYEFTIGGEMVASTLLVLLVMWMRSNWLTTVLMLLILIIDMGFVGAHLLRLSEWWLPVVLAVTASATMLTWQKGIRVFIQRMKTLETPLLEFVETIEKKRPLRVPGTAVFLTSDLERAPIALIQMLKHYKVLHEHNVVLTIVRSDLPRIALEDRMRIEMIGTSFSRVTMQYGYMDSIDIPHALTIARKLGLQFDSMSSSFFVPRYLFDRIGFSGIAQWRDRLFVALAGELAADLAIYFQIPRGRLIEVGVRTTI